MSGRIRGAATALLLLAIAGAWRPLFDQITLGAESKLWFDGKSTVRDWSCKATQIDAAIDGASDATAAVLKGEKAVRTVTLTFPVAKLDCANGTMNGHMMKALNATKHEAIAFTLTGYELTAGSPTKGTLTGTLLLNGVTRPITMPAEFVTAASGALRVTGKYSLTMTEWQVQPPKLMMGALKVNPIIVVNFDLQLQP
jgi:polyisoprenoid-binding protein YceI